MRKTLSPPIVGQSLSASWGAKLASDIRANRIIAGKGIYLSYTPNGTIINSNATGVVNSYSTTATNMWDVVWVPHDDDDDTKGEWQVYLPIGSLTVKYAANQDASSLHKTYAGLCQNAKGKDKNGKTWYGWFKIPDPKDEDAFISSDTYVVKAWTVYAEIKPWAKFWVSSDNDEHDPVAWKEEIATICVMEYTDDNGNARHNHYVIQGHTGAMEKVWDCSGPFALDYTLNDPTSTSSTYSVAVINQTKMLGRLQKNNVDPVYVTGADEVWVKIAHEDENFDLSVLTSVSDPNSNDDQTVYRIYKLDDDVVKEDNRDRIGDLPFYTNPAATQSSSGSGSSSS